MRVNSPTNYTVGKAGNQACPIQPIQNQGRLDVYFYLNDWTVYSKMQQINTRGIKYRQYWHGDESYGANCGNKDPGTDKGCNSAHCYARPNHVAMP